MNNTAEGYDRKTEKDRLHFFYIAKGSCAEVRSMLYLGLELGYISQEVFQGLKEKYFGINKMINSLIQKISNT